MTRWTGNRTAGLTLGAVGWSVMAFGVWSLWHDAGRTHPGEWIKWFAGAALVHDFVVAPIVFVIAIGLGKTLAQRFRRAVQFALVATGIFALISWPFVRGYGRSPANPSILPNNYARGLLIVLAVVWALTAIALVRAWRHSQTLSSHTAESDIA
jgi:hypothetical protein